VSAPPTVLSRVSDRRCAALVATSTVDRRSARLDHRRRLNHCGGEGMTNEFFFRDGSKRRDGALHGPILDNPAADEAVSRQAIERAMRRGLTRKQAERLYR
jgi:hypothetical protein